MRKPNLLLGALLGLLTVAPLIALYALGNTLSGLAFAPFDLFDWSLTYIPEVLVNLGKEIMTNVITGLNLGRLDTAAKTAEQAMAVGMMIVFGIVIGAAFFGLMNGLNQHRNRSQIPGIVLGVGVGVPLILISLAVNFAAAADPVVTVVWVGALSLGWGLVLHSLYLRLAEQSVTTAEQVSAEGIDRRSFLIRAGASAAVITVVGSGVAAFLARGRDDSTPTALASVDLPEGLANANDAVVPVPGTRPEVTPVEDHYRIDIRTTPLEIPEEGYTLPIYNNTTGTPVEIRSYTLEEIRAFPSIEAYITMACISNPIAGDLISTTLWKGVSMKTFLADMGIPEGATHLKIIAGDGFDETVALDVIDSDERVMLCYDWDGAPLPVRNGFPLRIHVPDLYGMKQPKWITSMEFLSADEDGYWVRRGWDKVARVRATSVIDVVYTDALDFDRESLIIPIGGIAWAGERGVSRVEVRVDGGEWQEAQVRAPISDRTWQLWRYDWTFSEGSHVFEVRMTEADGTPQIESPEGVRPSGATGIHSERASVRIPDPTAVPPTAEATQESN
jgi:DMSO/TMAO reductase YedYZ molybdopterin-dependent catalytic subunit